MVAIQDGVKTQLREQGGSKSVVLWHMLDCFIDTSNTDVLEARLLCSTCTDSQAVVKRVIQHWCSDAALPQGSGSRPHTDSNHVNDHFCNEILNVKLTAPADHLFLTVYV